MTNGLPTLTIRQSMALAWQHHQAGSRDQAGMICLRVLQVEPQNADALHLLGVLAYQANDQVQAIDLLNRAIRGQKRVAPMHGNLALAKLAHGDLVGAAISARKAFELSPSYADAHRVLGLVHLRRGRAQQALEEFRRAQALGLANEQLEGHLREALEQLQVGSASANAAPQWALG